MLTKKMRLEVSRELGSFDPRDAQQRFLGAASWTRADVKPASDRPPFGIERDRASRAEFDEPDQCSLVKALAADDAASHGDALPVVAELSVRCAFNLRHNLLEPSRASLEKFLEG